MSTGPFHDKNYLVTGGSSGIGLATAKLIASKGGNVVIVGRNPEKLETALAQLKEINASAKHAVVALDLATDESEAALTAALKQQQMKLSGAVLCAGSHSVKPFAIANATHFKDLFQANFFSAVNAAKSVTKSSAAEGCSLVFMSSVAAIRGGGGVSAYSSAKAALSGFMKTLAMEYAGRKLRVNSVLPGVVKTEMTEGFFGSLSDVQKEQITKAHPLGLGEPNDVASVVCFLLSNDSRWVTGTELVVDGGLSVHS